MTALGLNAPTLSSRTLEQRLAVARQQAEMFTNALFIAGRVRTHTDFPDMPSAESGRLESTEDACAVPLREVHRSADVFAVQVGYLAKMWESRIDEIEAMLYRARQEHP